MLKEKTKDITINDEKYRLTRMDARTGSYVAAKVAMLLGPMLSGGEATQADITKALPALNRRDFDELQTILLKTVQHLKVVQGDELPEPVVKANGDFVDSDLAYDVSTVIALTVHALMFNVGGFFAVAGLLTDLA